MTASGVILRGVVTLTFVFLLLPMAVVVITSFSASPGLVFPPERFTSFWYRNISDEFLDAMGVSVLVAMGTTTIAVLVGTPAALALARGRFIGRQVIMAICLSPLMVSTLVIGVAGYQYAVVLWDFFGISVAGSLIGLVLGQAAFTVPFVIRSAMAGQSHFDEALEEASLGLGASPLETFFRVTLPIIRPGIVSGALFAFIMSFDDVPIALFLGGGNNTTLPVKIYSSVEFDISAEVMAVGTIVIAGSLLCMLVLERTVGLHLMFGTKKL
jgi:putative spermidine/putrescine transport system permease protein